MPRAKIKPLIIVDTREQMPYAFSPAVNTVRLALPTGDYSVGVDLSLGIFSENVAVERKSLDDFIGSVIHDRDRFLREVERLSLMQYVCVVVEGSINKILNHDYASGAHPNSIIGSAVAIHVDFGVPVYFLENRQIAENFTERFLSRVWARINIKEIQNGIITESEFRDDPGEGVISISDDEDPPWLVR